MNYHKVTDKEINYNHRDNATSEILTKLGLSENIDFDSQIYLERLLENNMFLTA